MKTFSILGVAFVLSALSLTACGSSGGDNPPTTPVDSGTESAIETGTPVDSGKDTKDAKPPSDAPVVCDQDLPKDFVCKAPTKTAGSTKCSEAALQDFLDKCIKADFTVPAACADWRTANPDCNSCIMNWIVDPKIDDTKVYPDRDKCYWALLDDTCAKTLNCSFDCQDAVCTACDTSAGTGADGVASEWDDCIGRAIKDSPKGRCWDVAAKDVDACFAKTETKWCYVDEYWSPTGPSGDADLTKLREGVLEFYRGACRDNGVWTSAQTAGDAGPSDAADGG